MKLTYGQRLQIARNHKGLSQPQLAEISGVGQGSISKIERGGQDSSSYDAVLAYHLEVEAMWLSTGDDKFAPDWLVLDNKIKKTQDKVSEPPSKEYKSIHYGSFRLEAGINGFTIDFLDEKLEPIFLRESWLIKRGLKAEKLLACEVTGESMEPTLSGGDSVIINTADVTPQDGKVFAINYEGELVIKRLHRDSGQWFLQSDNPDKTRYPNKHCSEELCLILGKIVYILSETI